MCELLLAAWFVFLLIAGRNPQWFMPIQPGDKPSSPAVDESEGVFRARKAVEWIDEWRESRAAIAAALAEAV